ncbi:Rieske (2Fe-2S) protein [Krasilnikovia sp. MM14-A1004]|uniref:Rieske (2Fe-2S) protein n=1 Tax=Krasilnikovia sp. MM14-A1004 TaxID=3373541 RepID=UPI00399C7F90
MTDVQARTDTANPQGEPTRSGVVAPRRAVLAGAGALGATCLLAACGTSSSSSGTNPSGSDFQNNPAPAGSKGADAGFPAGQSKGGGSKGGDSGGATALAAVADVPKGGGIIQGDLVITQPSEGTFKAFSKVCTHAGCDVNKVDGGLIKCPCHGSTFSIEDGSPQGGPATKGLPETKVKVDGDNIVQA